MSLKRTLIRTAYQNPMLRPHLLRLLQANSCKLLIGANRAQYLDAVWEMYRRTYGSIGLHITNPTKLLEYDIWNVCFNTEGAPSSFDLYERTPFGLKGILSGNDGSSLGIAQTVANFKKQRPGVYAEVSHKVKDFAFSIGTPVVCNAYVSEILGKPIVQLPDGISYERTLSGLGKVTKVMVGLPHGIPTTNPHNPICPVVTKTGNVDMNLLLWF